MLVCAAVASIRECWWARGAECSYDDDARGRIGAGWVDDASGLAVLSGEAAVPRLLSSAMASTKRTC